MRFNRRHILIILLVLTILAIFLPIYIRYSFITTAKIYPLKEWKLSRGASEGFLSQSYNYETNAVSDLKEYRFERGDIAELMLRNKIINDTLVSDNDTVATIKSFFIENEITRLKNLRDVEMATLNMVSTGEKQTLVSQAQKQYDYALQQYDLEKKNFARQQSLYRDSVITPSEFDISENALKLAEINAQVAYNELMSVNTGEKASVLGLSEQKILSYEKEIERLESQKEQYTIVTPMAGILSYNPELGGIIKVSDVSRLMLKIPVLYDNTAYLANLHSVKFSTPDNKITIGATFKGFDESVTMIQFRQVVLARAVTDESFPGIYPGMAVKCRIYCDKVSLFEYIKRNFILSF